MWTPPIRKNPNNPPREHGELVPWRCPECNAVNHHLAITCRICHPDSPA